MRERESGRDRIARVLAWREAAVNPALPLGAPAAPVLLETPNFFDTEAEPAEPIRELKKRMEQERRNPSQPLPELLYRPQWMPADQPNDIREGDYYWKLQL